MATPMGEHAGPGTDTSETGAGAGNKRAKSASGQARNAPRTQPANMDGLPDLGIGAPTVNGMTVRNRPRQGQSVYSWIEEQYRQQGLGDLGGTVVNLLKSGKVKSPEQALTMLRDTPEYAKRFAGNVAREKAGLPMLSEKEYLQQESAYGQVLRQYGLPKGFYDDPSDFSNWIANDVSPDEIGQRASMASDVINSKDPALLATMKDYYGLDKGDLAAWYLDSDKALPVLQRKAQAASIGAEADRQGFDVGRKSANKLASLGITTDQARSAFGDAARDQDALERLADMDKTNLNPNKIAQANLGVAPGAAKKIRRLESQERGRFSGKSSGTSGLGGTTAGSF